MIKVRTFAARADAEAHRAALVARFKLPRHYSDADLDDGTIQERGRGRHVPPSEIVREPVPELHFNPQADVWAVAASESEEADETLAMALEVVPRRELVEPDEAPKARGGRGLVRDKLTGQLVEPKARDGATLSDSTVAQPKPIR